MNYSVTASHIALGSAIEAASNRLDVATAGLVQDAWDNIKNKAFKPALAKLTRIVTIYTTLYMTREGQRALRKHVRKSIFNKLTIATLIVALLTSLVTELLALRGKLGLPQYVALMIPAILLLIKHAQAQAKRDRELIAEVLEIHDARQRQRRLAQMATIEKKLEVLGARLTALGV